MTQFVVEDPPQRAVDVQVNGGAVVLAAQFLDPRLQPTGVSRQHDGILAQLLRDIVHQSVGQRGDATHDHLVGASISVGPALGMDGHWRIGQRQIPFLGDDLGHGHVVRQGHCLQ